MALEITWPRAHASAALGSTIVASGLADMSIGHVIGECRSTSDSATSVKCTVVGFMLAERTGKATLHYRWSILFKTPGPGDYVFTVTGLKADGKSDPERASVKFCVGLGLATIMHPLSYEDITLEASNFLAYGELFDYPLGLLEFKDASGQVIGTTGLSSDFETLKFWSASYPPLAPGLYSLHVEDTNGNGETAVDIYVGP